MIGQQPLVSVICFCKDRVSFMPRSIESVLNQTYKNIELVIQDGASTDGTLELVQSYAARDGRIKIVSEPDSGPAEAYWKVLHRCTGEYIATCLSDEELLPDAIEKAVGWFAASPNVGAITCDGNTTDADGKVIGSFKAGEFDFVAYLFGKYCPFWPGSFFRRQALLDIGLDRPGWNIGCLEFEIWCRLARDHEVKYISETISNYSIHPGQLSNTPANFHEHIENRLKLIEDMFTAEGFFGASKFRQKHIGIDQKYAFYGIEHFREIEAKINQLSQFEFHARAHKLEKEEQEFTRRIEVLRGSLIDLHEHDLNLSKWQAIKDGSPELKRRWFRQFWTVWEAVLGVPSVSPALPTRLRAKLWLQRKLVEHLSFHYHRPLHLALASARLLGLSSTAHPDFEQFGTSLRAIGVARIYDDVARIYESRGQIGEALDMWRRAEPLANSMIDSLACQSALKDPKATYASIAELQQKWADNHIRRAPTTTPHRFPAFDHSRKVRVAYHCSFMDADTIRYIMRRAIAAHDRSRFEVFAYAPMALPPDLQPCFDVVRTTANVSDDAFVELTRRDRIDVFVELSGFSPGHRYAAMATRCAPVQISYLNHFATSRVPNVDYVFSDEICTPASSAAQGTFSETIHLLPDCLLCYDYTDGDCPPVSALPSLANKFVTFGSLSSGGKINTQLVALWSEVMQRVPGSRIFLQNSQLEPPDNQRYMVDRFRRFGISPDRVILRSGTDRTGALKAYDQIDITLDTWPYCGGNTTAESLWQGVPVVSLKGERFSSRYGASLLNAAGCADLIANSREEFIDIAANLAHDTDRLTSLRQNLRQIYTAGGLNDSARFARNLEGAYLQMLKARSR